MLEEAVSDPERLSLKRCERAILFMDVRGFTAWSQAQTPEAVVAVLNGDCAAAEAVFARWAPIRCKFSADEVMAIFANPQDALAAARGLARGEILLSEDFRAAAGLAVAAPRTIEVEGKVAPLVVHSAPLDSDQAHSGPGGSILIP